MDYRQDKGRLDHTNLRTSDPSLDAPLDEKNKTGSPLPRDDDHSISDGVQNDPYGGRKLGWMRTCLIFFTNQVGLGILSLGAVMHTIGVIPGIITIVAMGILATYTAYILIQFYRAHPHIRDVADVGMVMGGKPLYYIVGLAHVLNLCLICGAMNITMSIALNTISNHAMCTIGFIAIPLVVCWLFCIPRTMNFAGWWGIPATISIFAAVFIAIISLGVNGPNVDDAGLFGEPAGQPLEFRLGPNPEATLEQQFNAVLNVAFAYAGNQAFVTVMCEMRNPSKDYTKAIIWLNVVGIPMYVLAGVLAYFFAGQYIRSPALTAAPGVSSQVAYGILFPTLLGSGLVFGHTGIKYMYNTVMDNWIKTERKLTDNTVTTWGVWLGCGAVFWITAFILANAIPAFGSMLDVSSAIFVSWFTFGMANAQWVYLNWGQQFSTVKKSMLAIFNWFMIIATCFITVFGLYTSIQNLNARVQDPDDPLNVFTCADNSAF